jgi:hypothetical protein
VQPVHAVIVVDDAKSIDECLGQSIRKGCIAILPKARRSSGCMHCNSK